MKMMFPYFFFIATLSHFSCNKENQEQIAFPLNFSYDNMEMTGTKMFVKSLLSFQETPLSGSFATYDSDVLEEMSELYLDLPFNVLTILSSDSAHLLNNLIGGSQNGLDAKVPYTTNGDKLTFKLSDGTNSWDFPMFKRDNNFTEIDLMLTAIQFTQKNGSNVITYSPVNAAPASSLNISDALSLVESSNTFQVGDTITIGFIRMAYR